MRGPCHLHSVHRCSAGPVLPVPGCRCGPTAELQRAVDAAPAAGAEIVLTDGVYTGADVDYSMDYSGDASPPPVLLIEERQIILRELHPGRTWCTPTPCTFHSVHC